MDVTVLLLLSWLYGFLYIYGLTGSLSELGSPQEWWGGCGLGSQGLTLNTTLKNALFNWMLFCITILKFRRCPNGLFAK